MSYTRQQCRRTRRHVPCLRQGTCAVLLLLLVLDHTLHPTSSTIMSSGAPAQNAS